MSWKDWAGYYAVCSYHTCHEREYYALRQAAAIIDVTPLYKFDVHGPDAAELLSLVMVKNVRKMKPGRMTYLCWCDDEGKVRDEGTLGRLEEDHFRVTSNLPVRGWLESHAAGMKVTVEETSERFGALSLQGPLSRDILKEVCDADLDKLRYFGTVKAKLEGVPVSISRTGYTGDLGYEIWIERDQALPVWDAIMGAGAAYRLLPMGLNAMDVSRIEAGFVLNGIDYFSSQHCLLDSRKSSPYEIGLGWAVNLKRKPFIGQAALREEKARGSTWKLVGLEYDWDEWEALFDSYGLPPQVPSGGWRVGIPVYDAGGGQVGQATSGTWSPILKKNIALATVRARHGEPGTRLRIEVTVEYERRHVSATVVKTPFFDPERKRA